MGAGVFVSYRRDDDPGWAGRVRDALANRFGEDAVFFDRDSIRGGDRWEAALERALDACQALVLVVGPRWVTCLQERQASGEPDFHVLEITTALDRGIVVYPVRVQGAAMPDLADLPGELRDRLPALQWTAIHDDLFRASMDRVIADLERAAGVEAPAPAATPAGDGAREVVVGPWDSDAEVAEIADAVSMVAPGGRIRVLPGRYLKPVVLDRPVSIVGAGRGDVVLDAHEVPAIRSSAPGVVVRRLSVRVHAEAGAVGIEVVGGDLTVDDVGIEAKRPAGTTALAVAGDGARLVVLGAEVTGVDVGLAAGAGVDVRVERSSLRAGAGAAVSAGPGATVRLLGCSLASAPAAVASVAVEGGSVTVEDSSIAPGAGSAVSVLGGRIAVRGSRGAASSGSVGAAAGRVVRAVPGVRPAVDDAARGGWRIVLGEGSSGSIEDAELAEVVLHGGDVRVARCTVPVVRAAGPTRAGLAECDLGRVELADGATPTFQDCTITPDRGVKVTVDVDGGSSATFEDCTITGRNVRDGSPDPAIRVGDGAAELAGCTVRNPGEGALWVEAGGRLEVRAGEVRSTVSGAAIVVLGGRAEVVGAAVAGGVRVDGGALTVRDGTVVGDAVSGRVAEARGTATVQLVGVAVTGPGLARTRKVGRWIESRSEKVAGATARLLGTEPVVVAPPASLRLDGCVLAGLEPAHLEAIDGVELVGCRHEGDVDAEA